MNKNLEAKLMIAAKAVGYGVVGVDPKRCADFGVECGQFVREGETFNGKTAKTTGYYTVSGAHCLTFDCYSPGDGWTRYRLAELRSEGTGHYNFCYDQGSMSIDEMRTFLDGISVGAEAAYRRASKANPTKPPFRAR